MKWIAIVVLMFATVGHAGKAEAGSYYTGFELLQHCEGDMPINWMHCNGYLAGISDTTSTYDDWGVLNRRDFCIPDSVNLGQLARVAIKGLNENPEKLHLAASGVVANIFYEAFPCGYAACAFCPDAN